MMTTIKIPLLFYIFIKLPYRKMMISHNYFFVQKRCQWFLPSKEDNPKGCDHYCQIEHETHASNLAILFHHSFFSRLSYPFLNQLYHVAGSLFKELIKTFACVHSACENVVFVVCYIWSYVLTIWKLNNDLVILFNIKPIMMELHTWGSHL